MVNLILSASWISDGRRPSSGAAPPAGALAPAPPPAPSPEGGAKRECCALEKGVLCSAVNVFQVAMLALVLVFLPPTAATVPSPLWDICTEDTRSQTILHQVNLIRRSRAAKTAHVAHICPSMATWAFSGGSKARPNAKTGRRSNGYYAVHTWRTAARMADDDATPCAKFSP